MTFEEYAQQHLADAGLSSQGIEWVRMGWNARGSFGDMQGLKSNQQGILDSSDHVTGNAVAMGDTADAYGAMYRRAIIIQFKTDDDIRAAIKSGQCRFTVLGGGV